MIRAFNACSLATLWFALCGWACAQESLEASTPSGGASTIGLAGDGANELPKVDVTADRLRSYAATHANTATKTDTPLAETPMTVEVVTPQMLRDEGITSHGLTQALSYLGVQSLGQGDIGEAMFFRGFSSWTTLWNGFRIEDITTNSGPTNGGIWMGNVDRLEVVKGPSSILYGRSEPGGAVNVETKKPQEAFHGEFDAGVGSWVDRWISADLTGALNQDRTLLYRVNLGDEDANSWYIWGPKYHSMGIAPALQWRVAPHTTLSYEGQYRKLSGSSTEPYIPVDPATGQPVNVNPDQTLMPGAQSAFDQDRSYLALEQQIGDDWSLSIKYMRNDAHNPVTVFPWIVWMCYDFPGAVNAAGNAPCPSSPAYLATIAHTTNKGTQATDATMVDLVGHFATGAAKHTTLLGVDYYFTRTTQQIGFDGWWTNNPVNYFNPPFSFSPPDTSAMVPAVTDNWTVNDRDVSLYAQDQLELFHDWHALLGGRYQHLREHSVYTSSSYNQDLPYEKDVFLPRTGLLWQALPWLSPYYSYSSNAGESQGVDFHGNPIRPELSRQHEFGAKGEWLGGRLTGLVTYFNLKKTNVASEDLQHPGFNIAIGEVRSTGYELNLQGEISQAWSVLFNYSDTHPLVTVGTNGAANAIQAEALSAGTQLPYFSNQQASLLASHSLSGSAAGWRLGGGVTWDSPANLDSNSTIPSKAYWVANVFGAREFKLGGFRSALQLNIGNLFNRHYLLYQGDAGAYAGVNNYLGGNWGTPREFKLNLRLEL
jgi:iron complex outermembrane receptor protein